MSVKPTVWIIWTAFSAYWLFVAVYSVQKLRTNSQWRPRALALYQERFGIVLSPRTYVLLVCLSAAIVISSGLWLPQLLIDLLTNRMMIGNTN